MADRIQDWDYFKHLRFSSRPISEIFANAFLNRLAIFKDQGTNSVEGLHTLLDR